MTVPITQASENQRGQAGSTPLISFPLITSRQSGSWFEWFDWWGEPKALKHQPGRASLRRPAKVMPYHIWHPKAWEIDPPVWPLIGLGFEHALGPSMDRRVRSKMCVWLSSFVTGIDDLPPWGRLAQSGHMRRTAWVYVTLCVCIFVCPQYVILKFWLLKWEQHRKKRLPCKGGVMLGKNKRKERMTCRTITSEGKRVIVLAPFSPPHSCPITAWRGWEWLGMSDCQFRKGTELVGHSFPNSDFGKVWEEEVLKLFEHSCRVLLDAI